jgi:hypothetical protein|tara:strand:+ start:279 stop:416 length:138 start_codon:yes stop_codon:yes gene_type:complete
MPHPERGVTKPLPISEFTSTKQQQEGIEMRAGSENCSGAVDICTD